MWHVVSVTSRMELDTVARISEAGFSAHCPTWVKKSAHHRAGKHFFTTKIQVLFPSYIFVAENVDFRIDKFESSRTRLMVFRKTLLTDEQMAVINSTAMSLTMAQQKATDSLKIRRGDVMQILHGAMQGEPVEVLEARRERITVVLKRFAGAFPVVIDASSLGRAV